MFRSVRRLPFFKLLAIVQVALLARRHLAGLNREERRRLVELSRHAHRMTPRERAEFRDLAMKLEPRAFAAGAADQLSPFPLPGRVTRGRRASGR
jgi:hypothetical protein